MQPTRRQLIAGSITLTTLGAGAALGTGKAAGQSVSVSQFDVADVNHETPDGMIQEITVTLNTAYEFDATVDIDTVALTLKAGRQAESATEIAAKDVPVDAQTDSGTATLEGPLSYAADYEIADFRPGQAGESISKPVVFVLEIDLLQSGQILAEASQQTESTVNVQQQENVLSVSVGGDGSMAVTE
jgi:hypothetical protein